ncbi:MAG TPA: CocE/NonD family hydrolase [Acidimicrobiales bacterium]|nr:CocE/NonD family hydrolase [Acidimicrobiales bacterium]
MAGHKRNLRRLAAGAAALITVALTGPVARATESNSGAWVPEAATFGYAVQTDQPVKAHDGTVLRADVYYPTNPSTGKAASGSFPVLLQQTPYGKESFAPGNSSSVGASIANTDIPYLVDRGYIVVIADVRGTGDSGGTFGLFDPVQATDGATLVNWAAHLPDSGGDVGLFGESYMGIDQFLTVSALPQNSPVKAMFPIISGHDIYSDTVTQGGIPDIEFSAFYLALVAGLNAANPALEPLSESGQSASPAPIAGGLQNLAPLEVAHNQALASYDAATLANVETGGDESYDGSYWQARSPATYLQDVVGDNIPAFLVGGWNDLFQQGELQNYAALQNLASGRPADAAMLAGQPATPRYQLMMGPWQHVTTGTGVNLAAIELEWFDTWLRGEQTPLATTTTPLHLEQLHSGKWIDTADWPLQEASTSTYYFGPGRTGTAQTSTNDGVLSSTAPNTAGADPVVWTSATSPCSVQSDQWSGGFLALAAQALHTTNPCDTNDATLEAGPGALTYTTAPFTHDEVIGGPIDATVYATSTTKDTEFVATIEEVSPTGQSVPLTSGALLGSFRKLDPGKTWTDGNGNLLMPVHPFTQASSEPVTPGQVTRYDIAVFPTFAEIPAGWALRVTLTTGDSPHLGPTAVQTTGLVGGVYQVQRGGATPSHINVPVAPAPAFAVPCGVLCSTAGP